MLPATMGIMSSTFVGRERATAFAAWGAVMGAAVAFGPLLGGFLTTNYSWRWAFRINVIVAPFAIVGALLFMRQSQVVGPPRAHRRARRAAHLVGHVPAGVRHQRGRHLRLGPTRCRRSTIAGRRHLADVDADLDRARRRSCCSALLLVRVLPACSGARSGPAPIRCSSSATSQRPAFRYGIITLLLLAMGQVAFLLRPVGGAPGRPAPLGGRHRAVARAVGRVHRGRLAARQLADPPHRHHQRRARRADHRGASASAPIADRRCRRRCTFVALLPGFALFGIGIGFAGSQLNNVILSDVPAERSGATSGANTTVRMIGASLGIAIDQLAAEHRRRSATPSTRSAAPPSLPDGAAQPTRSPRSTRAA